MSNLPELPRLRELSDIQNCPIGASYVLGYEAKDLRKYGDARAAHARQQALEEAAKVCETQIDPTRSCTTSGFAYWHAKQIKELLK